MSYDVLLAHHREIATLEQVKSLLHWDMQTMMPARGAALRAEEFAVLEALQHQKRTDPRVRDWLDAANAVGELQQAQLRELRRQVERAHKQPEKLVKELASVTSLAHGEWVEARQAERLRGTPFAKSLTRIIALKREQAACLSNVGPAYDALIDEFEPGLSSAELRRLFEDLAPALRVLLDRVLARDNEPAAITGEFAATAQLALSEEVARGLGYDFTAGRIDRAVHPFCVGGVPGDVRVTTRIDPLSFENCLYSTVHEVGHALYEQGIDPELSLTPVGEAISMGIHESQSRLWECHIGRSLPFVQWLWPKLRAAFPGLRPATPEELARSVNRVRPSFIRTESDEVTYNLHVLLRFELETALIAGDLQVDDLESAWDERMQRYLGIRPPKPSLGVLQDVHWSGGAFGYFPTYTLGNVYAAELMQAARRELGSLDAEMAQGNFTSLKSWLRDKVHRHGKRYSARDLMTNILGRPPAARALVDYLTTKLRNLELI